MTEIRGQMSEVRGHAMHARRPAPDPGHDGIMPGLSTNSALCLGTPRVYEHPDEARPGSGWLVQRVAIAVVVLRKEA